MNLGKVTLLYGEDGTVKQASFSTDLQVNVEDIVQVTHKLNTIQCDSEEHIREQALHVMASYFSMMTNVELADRVDHPIQATVETCDKYDNGNVKKCIVALAMQ